MTVTSCVLLWISNRWPNDAPSSSCESKVEVADNMENSILMEKLIIWDNFGFQTRSSLASLACRRSFTPLLRIFLESVRLAVTVWPDIMRGIKRLHTYRLKWKDRRIRHSPFHVETIFGSEAIWTPGLATHMHRGTLFHLRIFTKIFLGFLWGEATGTILMDKKCGFFWWRD